ncbi:MAG: TonB-dependent receptor family protein [Gemmatimonadales bacterium]
MTRPVVSSASLRRLTLIGCAIAALSASRTAPVLAQAEADTVPTFNLDSLVVTVLGTPVRFGASPFPVSVVGESELRIGKTGMFLEEALQSLPGVQVQNRFNYAVGERISIRGFGSRAQFGVRGIHVVVDGIPATLPDGQSTLDHVDIASLGRVEALRGPASAMYGNASGGVLRFESEIPAQTAIREEATVMGGSDGMLRLQSTTTGTVGQAAYLVSLNRMEYDGYRHFGTGATTGDAYGGARRLHINGRLEQPLAGGELAITVNQMDLDSENPGSLTRAQFDADAEQIAPTYDIFRTGKEVQQGQIGVTWDGMVRDYRTEAVVYGLTRDFNNPLPSDVVDLDRRAAGARLTLGRSAGSDDLSLDLLVGGEYDFMDDDRREYTNVGGQPDALTLNQTERVKGSGGFVQAAVTVQDRVSVVGALRYDHVHFGVEDLFPVTPGVDEDASGSRDMNKLSPTIGVNVEINPMIGVFANFATSFETPTTVELGNRSNGSGGFNPDLDPMTGKTVEGGLRGTVSNRVSFEVSVFQTKLENELIAYENADALTYYQNAGKTKRTGAEGIVRARLLEFATAQVSYSRTEAEFEEYVDLNGNDFSGMKVPGLAPQQLQGSLHFSQGPWYLELGAEYTDEVPVNDRNCLVALAAGTCPADASGNNQNGFTPSYTLFSARIGGSAVRLGGVEISPFAGLQNLTDEKYISSVTVNAFGGRFYEPGPGRTFFLGGTIALSR